MYRKIPISPAAPGANEVMEDIRDALSSTNDGTFVLQGGQAEVRSTHVKSRYGVPARSLLTSSSTC